MGRLPKQDRSAVADYTVGVRLPAPERKALELLLELQNERLREQGIAISVTAASYMRSLLLQKAQEEGLLPKAGRDRSGERGPLKADEKAAPQTDEGSPVKGKTRFERPDVVPQNVVDPKARRRRQ